VVSGVRPEELGSDIAAWPVRRATVSLTTSSSPRAIARYVATQASARHSSAPSARREAIANAHGERFFEDPGESRNARRSASSASSGAGAV
jgi:hypothetical protein